MKSPEGTLHIKADNTKTNFTVNSDGSRIWHNQDVTVLNDGTVVIGKTQYIKRRSK